MVPTPPPGRKTELPPGRNSRAPRRGPGLRAVRGALLLGAAVGLPALAHALIRRRSRPPRAPLWGQAHRFAGRTGEIAFQELGPPLAPESEGSPPLVLLHALGPGYDAGQWRRAAEALAARHRVYAPDLPGWGRSGDRFALPFAPELYVDTLHDFLSRVVCEPAVVVAAGHAAAFAVEVAAVRPGAVAALALVGPQGIGPQDGAGGPAARAFAALLDVPGLRASALDLLTSRAAIERHLRAAYAAPERVDAALLDHHYRASHQPAHRAALAALLAGRLDADAAPALARLEVPVWIAWGRAASAPPVEHADLWLQALPAAELDVLEGAGDLPHAEVPVAFARALDRFLSRRAPSGSGLDEFSRRGARRILEDVEW